MAKSPYTEKIEFNEGVNADDAYTRLQEGEYINGFNFRSGTSEFGKISGLQPIPSSTSIFANLPITGTNICIGSIFDESNRRILWWNWNSLGQHGIYCYDTVNLIGYIVLLSSQVNTGLNLSRFSYIHSAFVVNHNLYWTDNLNEPRRLNIESGIKLNQPGYVTTYVAYTAPMNESVIAWIRRPPAFAPNQVKSIDGTTQINTIGLNAFQFCFYFTYRDYEISVTGPLSTLANYNSDTDVYNYIAVNMSFSELIDQDVLRVQLVARYLNSGVYFTIRTWDKTVAADAAAITAHNTGTTPLTYNFYNTSYGTPLAPAFSVKPYDSVPITAPSCDLAHNLSFLVQGLMGYNPPTVTSLTATVQGGSSGVVTGNWFFFKFQNDDVGNITQQSVYLLDITNLQNPAQRGYYIVTGITSGPFPASVNWTSCTFVGAGLFDVMNYYFMSNPPSSVNSILQFTDQNASSIVNSAPGITGNIAIPVFKSAASYQLSITFYDNYRRRTGAVTNSALVVPIPDRTFAAPYLANGIRWALSNINAAAEIPSEAYYYSIDITNCLRTRFFLQGQALAQQAGAAPITYVGVDTSGKFTFANTTYSANYVGIGVDISCLTSFGQGYTFAQGDIIKLYLNNTSTVYSLAVTNVSANWLICQLASIGTLDDTVIVLFEIYTPYTPSALEPYYEVGQIFPVYNPGTPSPTYSVTAGTLTGDTTLIQRTNVDNVEIDMGTLNYLAEAMSPNDKFYRIWNTNAGQPNFVDTIGQQTKTDSVSYSNTLIQGSKTNGLSTFDALDTQDLSLEFGAIQKLKLTSKIEKEGSIMLAICTSETVSLYLGETQVAAPQGNAFLSVNTGVIGTIYPLKGSFGTINPESVAEYRGDVFWADAYNGGIVQYSQNGLELISRFKMRTFWRVWFRQYVTTSQATMVGYGSQPFLPACVDPFNGEYLISIPQILPANPQGALPGGITGAPPNLFNVYDGQAKTMSYKIDQNKWMPSYSYAAESLCNESNLLYGFKTGAAWLMNDENSGTFNTFFGTQYPSQVMFAPHAFPNSPKEYQNINVEADLEPDSIYIMSDYPWTQITDLVSTDLSDLEGVFYSSIFRDRLSPLYAGNFDEALYYGDPIIGKAPMIQLNFTASQLFHLKYVNIGYQLSAGHHTIASK
jgi:hypothetical protein